MANPRLSIRTKLIGIMNAILILAAGAIVIFATNLFSSDNTARVQEGNLETARLVAAEVRNNLVNLTEKMRLLGVTALQTMSAERREAIERPFYEGEKDFIAQSVVQFSSSGAKAVGQTANSALIKSLDVPVAEVWKLHQQINEKDLRANGELVRADQLKGDLPVLTIAVPLITDESGAITHAAVATVRQDRFLKSVETNGITTSYLVDHQGNLLAHPEHERILKKENVANLEIVKQLLSGKTNNGQTRFVEAGTKVAYLGAFKKVGFANIGVIAQVPEEKALEAARKVRITSILLTGIVSVFAFLFVFFYSMSMTNPILNLVDATGAIEKGQYEIHLKDAGNDELGDLTRAFNHMAHGLAEREKIKNAFSKFHSKDIADKILAGDLVLTGERKKVAVFFSDIRGFTSISEKLQPEQVVELVNSYMTRMVRIIFAHGGVVDKYVGDAIMAVYGTPIAHDNDAFRAVSAAIRMRAEMERFNQEQVAQGKPTINIGMGIHTGDVVAGNVGSPERMEYTILGDNVNLTSRIESLTKEFKTDLLISESVYQECEQYLDCEVAGKTKVKGKETEVTVYKVRGFKAGAEYLPPETQSTGETQALAQVIPMNAAGATPPDFKHHDDAVPPPFKKAS